MSVFSIALFRLLGNLCITLEALVLLSKDLVVSVLDYGPSIYRANPHELFKFALFYTHSLFLNKDFSMNAF